MENGEESHFFGSNLTDAQKVLLLNDLAALLPDTAEELFQKAEKAFISDPLFLKLDENQKVEFIINKIFEDRNFINENIQSIILISNYLKNANPKIVGSEFSESVTIINHYSIFRRKDIQFTEEDLNPVIEAILLSNEIFESTYSEINAHIKHQIDFIKESMFWTDSEEITFLKKKLFDCLNEFKVHQEMFSELYNDNLKKLKFLQDELVKIMEQKQKTVLKKMITEIIPKCKLFIKEQDDIISQSANFQLLPIEHIIQFPQLIKNISIIMERYFELVKLIVLSESNKFNSEEINSLKHLESLMSNRFKLFYDTCKKNFGRYMHGIADPKSEFKKRFIEPVKLKMDKNSHEILVQFVDLIF